MEPIGRFFCSLPSRMLRACGLGRRFPDPSYIFVFMALDKDNATEDEEVNVEHILAPGALWRRVKSSGGVLVKW
jgi:hypothetical protein